MVLVGGSSRLPLVRSLAAKLLGKLPLMNINPDHAIAQGAAVQVGLMAGDSALDEVVLTDVAPYSLGVGVYNEHSGGITFSPIIERNTPIPASRVSDYVTVQDGQGNINLVVYQGESLRVEDNIRLGELDVKVPRAKAGVEGVDVRFTYDINGVLEVETKVHSTGENKRLLVRWVESGG